MRPARWSLVAAGAVLSAYAVVGALADPDVRPVRHLLFLTGVLVAHDAVVLPAAIGVGILIGRVGPPAARVAVRVAAFVTATLSVVAAPLVLGLGRRPDNPSVLPLHYGRGLAIAVLLIWAAALAAVLAGRRSTRQAAPPRDR